MQTDPKVYRRSWRSQAQVLTMGLGLIFLMSFRFHMIAHGRLTGWAYLQGAVIFALVFYEMIFLLHRPTLKLDAEGVHLQALQYGWTYRWRDIQGVEEFQHTSPSTALSLGLRVRPEVAPQHRLGEAIWRAVYGYQAVIGDGWDVPLAQLRESMERFRQGGVAG